MQSYFSNAELLKTPGKRAAYSDRTTYMMAEMSRLVVTPWAVPWP